MTIDTSPAIEIIAELAQGFEGRPEQARLLLRAAAAAGADAAKFHLVYAEELATPDYKYFELFRSLEMVDTVWEELAEYSRELGIALHLDIFGTRSLALAEHLGAKAVKVHGTDIANVSLLNQIAQTSIPKIMLGSGGAFLSEIEQAAHLLAGKEIVVFLGFQGYPTPNDANQIARVSMLSNLLSAQGMNFIVGFADHAPPESPLRLALAATALGAGARVFEKHLTLSGVMKMEDYEAALNPDHFAEFVAVLRDCAKAYGRSSNTTDFGMSDAEYGYRKMIRRHVVTQRAIFAGKHIEPEDLVLKRSSSENALNELNLAYGAIARRDIAANEPLALIDLSDIGDTK